MILAVRFDFARISARAAISFTRLLMKPQNILSPPSLTPTSLSPSKQGNVDPFLHRAWTSRSLPIIFLVPVLRYLERYVL